MVQNKGLIFKSIPTDWPVEGKDLTIEDRGFDLDTEPPKHGITTKNYYLSFDPYQRGRMRAPQVNSYAPPFELGKPITNAAVSKVLKSNNSKFKQGDIVTGTLPTEEYSTISGEVANTSVRKLNNPYNLDPKLYIGALGMPGLTAYSSFYAIGEPKKGETIFISAASGAVGQIVGQLAKHEGLKVIGSVGSDNKLDFIKEELNFDEGFNYKKEQPSDALKRLAPKGIDIYYENVGGEQLDAAIAAMNNFGRIGEYGRLDIFLNNLPFRQLLAVWFHSTTYRTRIKGTESRTSERLWASVSKCKVSLWATRTWAPSTLQITRRTSPNGSRKARSKHSRV